MIKYNDITLSWLGHDGFIITGDKTIVIDPFKLEKRDYPPADIVISTHEHFDHCDPDSLRFFVDKSTTHLIGIKLAEKTLKSLPYKELHIVKPKDVLEFDSVKIEVVPAYNVNKYRYPQRGVVFHPKEDNKIGVIIEMNGARIYHAGDTDVIPEMKDFKVDVALLPVSGTYVMTAEEAIKAVSILRPQLAIPMHFGAIVGDKTMAEAFKKQADCLVEIPKVD